jgi:hypothetical protein
MRRLRELEALLAAGEDITVVDVLRAQIEPVFLMHVARPEEAAQLRHLFGRALTDPSGEVVDAMAEIFTPQSTLFFSLLRKVSPDLEHTEFYWRANCVVGAFSFVETYTERLTMFIDEDLSEIDWAQAADHVVRFLAAGMAAAPTPKEATKKRSSRAEESSGSLGSKPVSSADG